MRNNIVDLITAEFMKSAKIFVRYPLANAVTLIMMCLVFAGIFETASRMFPVSGANPEVLRLVIQKYLIWVVMIMGFGGIVGSLRDDMRAGTLELLWLSAWSPVTILVIKSLISQVFLLLLTLVMGIILSTWYGVPALFDVNFLIGILNAALCATGVGFILAGGVIVFKDIGPSVNLIQFVMLPIYLGVQPDSKLVMALLPGFSSIAIVASGELPRPSELLWIFLPTVIWIILGILTLSVASHRARHSGSIYEY